MKERLCKFSNGIIKHWSIVLKAIATLIKNNPFSVYDNNYVEISSKYNGDPNESNISITFYKKWCETISDELQSNVTVLKDMIDVRNGGKISESLGMDAVQFIIDDIVLIECSKDSILYIHISVLFCIIIFLIVLSFVFFNLYMTICACFFYHFFIVSFTVTCIFICR